MEKSKQPKPRGFAAMTVEQRKAIAARGGKKSHANGTAHRFTSETAFAAQAQRKNGRKDEL